MLPLILFDTGANISKYGCVSKVIAVLSYAPALREGHQMLDRAIPTGNPFSNLSDSENDLLGCLVCGMTVAAAAKVLGLGVEAEARLVADARFRSLVRASAAHLATIASALPRDHDNAGKVIIFPRR